MMFISVNWKLCFGVSTHIFLDDRANICISLANEIVGHNRNCKGINSLAMFLF